MLWRQLKTKMVRPNDEPLHTPRETMLLALRMTGTPQQRVGRNDANRGAIVSRTQWVGDRHLLILRAFGNIFTQLAFCRTKICLVDLFTISAVAAISCHCPFRLLPGSDGGIVGRVYRSIVGHFAGTRGRNARRSCILGRAISRIAVGPASQCWKGAEPCPTMIRTQPLLTLPAPRS